MKIALAGSHRLVTIDCQNEVVSLVKEIEPLDGTAVRCGADRRQKPALFLFVANGISDGRWAYCDEHARVRACRQKLDLPREAAVAAGSY